MSGKPSILERIQQVSKAVNGMLGVPDYDRYLKDHAVRHPGEEPMNKRDFEKDRLHDRFIKPGNKCV